MTRISAYVLGGDPVHLEASILSYYHAVDAIVFSYDHDGLSWTGTPMPVQSCIDIIKALDVDQKIHLTPGNFSDSRRNALESDTAQRQAALDAASQHGDWVIQLDADEVMSNPTTFMQCLHSAIDNGFDAMDFPSRWLYALLRGGRALEASRRFWGPAMSYPGPLAVKATSRLRLCRQTDGQIYRVDVRASNTDPFHPKHAVVHQVISPAEAVLHYSWARPLASLEAKAVISGHATDWDWQQAIAIWRWRQRHPWLATALTPLRRHGHPNWLRVARIDQGPIAT